MQILGLCFDETAIGSPFTHDVALVGLSFVVAVVASYTALELAERLRGARGGAGSVWHAASAIVLGGGIWSMHFIAMLAFETPLETGYDLGLTALSALVAIAVVALGFWIVRGRAGWFRIIAAGLVVGFGVVAMHYTGMAALRVSGEVFYRPSLFALSVVIALGAATVALWLSLTLQSWWQRLAAAFVMAVAICGMHYTGMAATAIVVGSGEVAAGAMTVSEPILAAAVSIGVFGFVVIGLVGAFYDRRREADAIREAARLRALNESLEHRVALRTQELQIANDSLDRALRQAERASSAKSEFLASMSHELRTPLNSILGFAQLLMSSKSFEPLSAKQSNAVRQIEHAGTHLLHLIDEILDLSRIEAGRLSLSLESVDVTELINEVTAMLQPSAIEAGVTIHVASPQGRVEAHADRKRLQQVLINLLSNAIKYNKRGGEANVSARIVAGRAQISVSDTGAGIPAEYMEDLFEPFNRLGQEQSAIVGSGVGLALCKRLLEAQNGEIHASSKEGMGSTFTVMLPFARVSPSRVQVTTNRHTKAAPPPKRDLMLYVEDNPANVLLMRHIVEELDGLDLLVATHPNEGVELARAAAPTLILLDINLPGMDGFEVLRILKADPATARIPVFALTASAMPHDVERGRAAGFAKYLTKPVNVPKFIEALREVFKGPDAPPSRLFAGMRWAQARRQSEGA